MEHLQVKDKFPATFILWIHQHELQGPTCLIPE